MRRILRRARKAAVLIDEAYYEFCGITALPLINDYPNLFVSRTFSKVFGMAAMRLGCLFSQSGNVEFLHKAFNQRGELVAECKRQAMMRKRPKA